MVIDHERAYLRLREHVLGKRSHGQDELLREMARIEIECEIPEGQEGFDIRPPRPGTSERSPHEPAAAGRELVHG